MIKPPELSRPEYTSAFDVIDEQRRQLAQQHPAELEPIFKFLTYQEVAKLPKKVWLVENCFGPGDIGMIFGEPATGKTFITIDLMFAAITGLTWAHQFRISRPLSVVYCTSEGRGGIPQRLKAGASWYGLSKKSEPMENLSVSLDVPQLFEQEAEKYISQFVDDYLKYKGEKLDLLIIDTLHNAAVGSKENDSTDAGQVIAATRLARDTLGCAVILIHHANRAGSGYRGSSAYEADMDFMFEVKGKVNGSRELVCFKSKDAPHFDPLAFSLHPEGESVYVVWEGRASEVQGKNRATELLDQMKTKPNIKLKAGNWGETIGVSRNYATNLLNELLEKNLIKRDVLKPNAKNSPNNPWVYWYEPEEPITETQPEPEQVALDENLSL